MGHERARHCKANGLGDTWDGKHVGVIDQTVLEVNMQAAGIRVDWLTAGLWGVQRRDSQRQRLLKHLGIQVKQ